MRTLFSVRQQNFVVAVSAAALFSAKFALAATPAAPASYKFQFGASQAAPGYTLVAPTSNYSPEAGYGFEPGATLTTVTGKADNPLQASAVTSAKPFAFSLKAPEGNYRVTVTLGDPTADAATTVKAETRRLMVEHDTTTAGKSDTRTFTVNVRQPAMSNGDKPKLDSREMNLETNVALTPSWDDKLTITFSDTHPAVSAIEIQKVSDAITVFVMGDSTVTDQPGGGASWGQMFTRWFKPEVAIANHAESGETMKGFLKEHRWDKVLDTMKPGDYALLEFGTNDSKNHGPQNIYPNQDFSETYAEANTTFKDLLKQFAADVQKKGGFPVIVSCSAHRGETTTSSLGAYAKAAGEAAKEAGLPFIDLNAMGMMLNTSLGADAAAMYGDQTHHVEYGAYMMSKNIALGLKQNNLPLAKYLVDDFGNYDPNHPEPTLANYKVPSDRGAPGGRGAGGRGGRGGRGGANAPAANAPATSAIPAAASGSN
jgi:lysophospholipase L1-like esterase